MYYGCSREFPRYLWPIYRVNYGFGEFGYKRFAVSVWAFRGDREFLALLRFQKIETFALALRSNAGLPFLILNNR